MPEIALNLKIAAAGLCFASLFILERFRRAAPAPRDGARLRRNLGLWLVLLAVSPVIVAPLTALGANELLWRRPDWLNTGGAGAAALIADCIILDCWTYWLHRAYHEQPLMWRLHEVHHRDEFLDTTSAVRFHIGEVALSAVLRLIPIAIIAAPLAHVLIFETVLLCAALFHHSNIRLNQKFEKVLSRFVVTPSIHWVHHHADKRDTNSNYASILSIWDPLFSTRSPAKRQLTMKIGVEGLQDKGFIQLIFMPFLRRKA